MARANPTADLKHNRGWPGCCRPPLAHEWDMVKDLDIATMIACLHDVPIPPNTKKRLEASASPRHAPRPPVQVDRDAAADNERRATIRSRDAVSVPPPATGAGLGSGPGSRPQPPRRPTADTSVPLAPKKSATTLQLMASLSLAPAPRSTIASVASSGSSDSGSNHGGAMSDSDSSTVRSEFTDYLSEVR